MTRPQVRCKGKRMKATDIRGTCPNCYRRMIKATDVFGDEAPMHGDIAICNECGEPAMFDFTKRKNTLRRPTIRESLDIEKNPSANRLRAYQASKGGDNGLQNRSHH